MLEIYQTTAPSWDDILKVAESAPKKIPDDIIVDDWPPPGMPPEKAEELFYKLIGLKNE